MTQASVAFSAIVFGIVYLLFAIRAEHTGDDLWVYAGMPVALIAAFLAALT